MTEIEFSNGNKIVQEKTEHMHGFGLIKSDAELFAEFLKEYLENVKRELPESYRARQLQEGGVAAELVFTFEKRFLEEPFMKAIDKVKCRHAHVVPGKHPKVPSGYIG